MNTFTVKFEDGTTKTRKTDANYTHAVVSFDAGNVDFWTAKAADYAAEGNAVMTTYCQNNAAEGNATVWSFHKTYAAAAKAATLHNATVIEVKAGEVVTF